MKKIIVLAFLGCFLTACHHESLEDRAEREAKEFTQKSCPTPVVNFQRTDSTVFYKDTKTYTCYCSFTDKLDNKEVVEKIKKELHKSLLEAMRNNTSLKKMKEPKFNFEYIIHSDKDKNTVLFHDKFTPKDYK